MVSDGICPDRSWHSLKARFNKVILPNLAMYNVTRNQLKTADEANAEGVSAKGAARPTGHSRYKTSDDEAIIKHIVENLDYERVGGNQLWIEMERGEVVSGRSWQSLKERFKKVIMRNLSSFRFLTKEQRSSLEARKIVRVDKEEVESVAEDEVEVDEMAEKEEEVHVSYILMDF